MLESQEIDALLISALYGELTPAEETRLEAHLGSHPADKSALAALTSTREAVRSSRILQIQLEGQGLGSLRISSDSRSGKSPTQSHEGHEEEWITRA